MNSKKAITLLVLTTLIIGMIPVVSAEFEFIDATYSDGDPLPTGYLIYKGDKIAIIGDGVASGDIVEIYWDDSSIAWNGVKGKLNDTTGSPDGSFEVWFKVPEAVYGPHYVWVRTGTFSDSIQLNVRPKVSLSATSGLEEDKIDVSGYGLVKETDVAVFFTSTETLDTWLWGSVTPHNYAADNKITGTLTAPVEPGTVVFTDTSEGKATFTTGDGAPTTITVTAPTITADFTAALYDAAGTTLLAGPTASTEGDTVPDTVALTYGYAASTGYTVKITAADEDGSYTLADNGTPAGSGGPITVVAGIGDSTFTTGDGAPTTITVTAPTITADFTAALYDAAGTTELVAPIASTEGDTVPDTVVLTYAYVASTVYTVKITLATETGDYVLLDNGVPAGSGGSISASASDVIDDGEGGLYYDADEDGVVDSVEKKVGTVNYVTGAFSIDYTKVSSTTIPAGPVKATYDKFEELANTFYLLTTVGDSNALGSYVKRVTIPTETDGITPGDYYIGIMDAKGHNGVKKFKLGSVITMSKSEGPVGTVVRITGRGFTPEATITETEPDEVAPNGAEGVALTDGTTYWKAKIVNYDSDSPPKVSSAGEFRIDIYVPDPDEKSEDYEIVVNDGTTYATAGFEVTAIPEITLSSNYGAQGSRFTVKGTSFVNLKDEKVYFYLYDQKDNDYDRDGSLLENDDFSGAYVKVNSDGSFTKELRVPTQLDGTYDMVAIYWHTVDEEVNMDAKKSFRVGTILVLLSEDEEASGRKIILSGNGFTESEKWNATFGGETLIDDSDVTGTGLISGEFFVPQVSPGVYDIVVTDIESLIRVIVEFTVTEDTQFTADPTTAPTSYNITFTAQNWPEGKLDWEFTLYNVTSDGATDRDWDITDDVTSMIEKAEEPFMAPNEDMEALGWWILEQPNGDELGKGTYLLNITNTDDYYMQLTLVVGDEHVSIAPRKATFRIGDTVSLDIQHSFGNVLLGDGGEIYGGKVKIYDPDDKVYWTIDALEDWTKSGMYYYVPAANQVANTNPMILLNDAPLGTWTYKWYANSGPGESELIAQGTFNVEASEAEVLTGQIDDLNQAIDDLTDDITGVSDSVAGLKTDINSAIQAANAAVDAANAATAAVNAVAGIAGDAAEAADRAAEAAGKAQDAAGGLTTLVYGAIGASLVAALAAIVSLMQISRRIAG